MSDLKKQLNKIKKSYFTFADARKISRLDDASLRVAISRLLKSEEISGLAKGYYSLNNSKVNLQKLALEIYYPSYLSFEWALGQSDILSQKSHALTLATTKRAKIIEIGDVVFNYHHLRNDLYFGFTLQNGYLIADPEKAFLDLAYLSLNGYANFDPGEMNLKSLRKNKIKEYLKKFGNKRLERVINNFI